MNTFMKRIGFPRINYAPEGSGGGATPSGSSETPASSNASPSASSSTPASTPASSPSPGPDAAGTPASGAPASPSPLGDDPFAGFGADEDDVITLPPEVPAELPVQAAPTPQAPAQAQPPVAPMVPPAAAQQPAPAAQAQPVPGQQETTPLPSPAEPGKVAQSILGNIDSLVDHLVTTPEFRLSEADIEAIDTDVHQAIPRMMARTFLRAQAGALAQMERVVPAIIERFQKVSAAREKSQSKFYSSWPTIKKEEHGDLVDQVAMQYRQMNPSASFDQMVKDVGPLVMLRAGIPLMAQAAPAANGQPQVNGQVPVRRPPAPPFMPAVGGPASPPAAPTDDAWSGYGAQEE